MATITEYLKIILEGNDLTFKQAKKLLDIVFEGEVADVQIAASVMRTNRCVSYVAAGTKTDGNNEEKDIDFAIGGAGACTSGTAINAIVNSQTADDWRLEVTVCNTAAAVQRITWKAWDGATVTQGYEDTTINTAIAVEMCTVGECATGTDVITHTMLEARLY